MSGHFGGFNINLKGACMRNPSISELDYIELQRFEDEEKRLNKQYRYKHKKVFYDSTEWREAVSSLRHIIYMKREGWIGSVELLEEL